MSSREPLWFCHECEAEMRPLMVPDPHCASCNGTFVEKMENPEDDPREFAHAHHEGDDLDNMPGLGMHPNFLFGLQSLFTGGRAPIQPTEHEVLGRARSQSTEPAIPRPVPNGFMSGGGAGGGVRFQMTSGSGSNVRTWTFGGGNTLGGGTDGPRNMEDLMRRRDEPGTPRGDISGAMMAQYLMALLAGGPGRGGRHGGDMFGDMLGGPEGGRLGDYAFSQEALDQIMTEIMENSNAHRPVAATDEVIDKLPREVLEEGSPLLEKDCAVCKEQFRLETEDPDEQIVVTLPCKHPFHSPCILPWLKSSGTCPVCRFALVPQPDHHPAPGAPGGPNSHSASPPRSPGTPGNEGGGIIGAIMGMLRSGPQSNSAGQNGQAQSGNASSVTSGSGSSASNTRQDDRRTPGDGDNSQHLPGQWD